MLAFQQVMLEDEVLCEPARQAITAGATASAGWRQAMDAEIAGYEAAETSISGRDPAISSISATECSMRWPDDGSRCRKPVPAFRP